MTHLEPGTLCLIVSVSEPKFARAIGKLCTVVGPDMREGAEPHCYEIDADWIHASWPRYARRESLKPILPPGVFAQVDAQDHIPLEEAA